jgi:uncharacterized membrane protein
MLNLSWLIIKEPNKPKRRASNAIVKKIDQSANLDAIFLFLVIKIIFILKFLYLFEQNNLVDVNKLDIIMVVSFL